MIKNVLTQGAFWQINKKILKAIGIEPALLLTELIDSYYFYKDRDELNKRGFFYKTAEAITATTTLSYHSQKKAQKILCDLSLIDIELKGVPAKLNFKINEQAILELLNSSIENTQNLITSKTSIKEFLKQDIKEIESSNNIDNNPNNNKTLSVPDLAPPLVEKESKKPKPSTLNSGLKNQDVLGAYDAMRVWLGLEPYQYPEGANSVWKKIHNNCKQILEAVCSPSLDREANMIKVKRYFYSVADLYKMQQFPFKKLDDIGIDRVGSAGIIPTVLNHVPAKGIKQEGFNGSSVNPKYVKDFKGSWHEVVRWGNNVAYTKDGQTIEVTIAEKTGMMRFQGEIKL